jgi:hypothetical protein
VSRAWLRAAIAALFLLALALAAGAFVYLSTAPHFAATLLSQLSGQHVEIGGLALRAGTELELVVRDLRVWPPDQTEGEPMLRVPKLQARHLWRRLLAGQLWPAALRAHRPELRVEVGAGLDRGPSVQDWLAALPEPPRIDLEVREGTLQVVRRDAPPAVIEAIDVELRHRGLVGAMGGTARAELRVGDKKLGVVTGDLLLDDALHVRSRLDELELAELFQGTAQGLRGRLSGTAEIVQREGELGARFDLSSSDLRWKPEGLERALAPKRAHLAGTATLDRTTLTLALEPCALDRLVARGEISIGLERDRQLRAALDVEPFEPGRPAGGLVEPIQLLALRFQSWEGIHRRIDGGRVLEGRIEIDVPLAELGESLAFKRVLSAEELRIRASVVEGTYRPQEESAPLHDISGSLEIAGDVLRVERLSMRRGGDALPQIDLEIHGMHRLVDLPPDERGTPAGPGVPIPGLATTFRALKGDTKPDPGEPPAPPLVLELVDAQIGYPAFVLPVRDARARLRFPEGELRVEEAEGVVGGAPARFDAVWDQRAQRVHVVLRYLDGEPVPRRDPGAAWVSGRVRSEAVRFGGFTIEGFEADLRATGARVELARVRGTLGRGQLDAQGNLSLAEPASAPYGFTTRIRDAEVARLNREIGLEPNTLRGRGQLEGSWTGRLVPERRFLRDARFEGSTVVESGVLAGLPPTMVLARLPSLQGVRGLFGRPLPFDKIQADFTIEQGRLRSPNFSLVGPELRVLAQGELDLIEPAHETDMIVALLMFETVDRVLERVPVVGRWVLGKDQSLVALYIRLEGPWKSLSAVVLPPESVRNVAGWAGELLSAGREQIERILSGELLPGVRR